MFGTMVNNNSRRLGVFRAVAVSDDAGSVCEGVSNIGCGLGLETRPLKTY